jgi:hypothetical protein
MVFVAKQSDADLKERFVVNRSNAGEFGVRFHEFPDSRANTLFAGTHARGGANSFLWISEWGYMQSEDVRRHASAGLPCNCAGRLPRESVHTYDDCA